MGSTLMHGLASHTWKIICMLIDDVVLVWFYDMSG